MSISEDIHPELVDLQDLIFNPMLDAGLELHKRIAVILRDRDDYRNAASAEARLADEFKARLSKATGLIREAYEQEPFTSRDFNDRLGAFLREAGHE